MTARQSRRRQPRAKARSEGRPVVPVEFVDFSCLPCSRPRAGVAARHVTVKIESAWLGDGMPMLEAAQYSYIIRAVVFAAFPSRGHATCRAGVGDDHGKMTKPTPRGAAASHQGIVNVPDTTTGVQRVKAFGRCRVAFTIGEA